MFSTCSKLTPHAPIPDGRMEQFMQPCALLIWLLDIYYLRWPYQMRSGQTLSHQVREIFSKKATLMRNVKFVRVIFGTFFWKEEAKVNFDTIVIKDWNDAFFHLLWLAPFTNQTLNFWLFFGLHIQYIIKYIRVLFFTVPPWKWLSASLIGKSQNCSSPKNQ